MKVIILPLCVVLASACSTVAPDDEQQQASAALPTAIDAARSAPIGDAREIPPCEDIIDCEGAEPATYEVVAGDPAEDPPRDLPPALDSPCDGVDQDGDGEDWCPPDADGDGYSFNDCDETDPEIHPDVLETWCDGIDQNCNGYDECDRDHDGVLDVDDCDPTNPAVGVCAPDGEPSPIP